MLTRQQILALIPHQGRMCLLDDVTAWSAADITCGASSHLSPENPLRRNGRLGAICGIEYGLQAAALHGALVHALPRSNRTAAPDAESDVPTPRGSGFLAGLRDVTLHVERLDDPRFGVLRVTAQAELQAAAGAIYRFVVASETGAPLVEGRGTIAFAAPAQ